MGGVPTCYTGLKISCFMVESYSSYRKDKILGACISSTEKW